MILVGQMRGHARLSGEQDVYRHANMRVWRKLRRTGSFWLGNPRHRGEPLRRRRTRPTMGAEAPSAGSRAPCPRVGRDTPHRRRRPRIVLLAVPLAGTLAGLSRSCCMSARPLASFCLPQRHAAEDALVGASQLRAEEAQNATADGVRASGLGIGVAVAFPAATARVDPSLLSSARSAFGRCCPALRRRRPARAAS